MGELLKEMGQRILDRRKQLKLTQEALAKICLLYTSSCSSVWLTAKIVSVKVS